MREEISKTRVAKSAWTYAKALLALSLIAIYGSLLAQPVPIFRPRPGLIREGFPARAVPAPAEAAEEAKDPAEHGFPGGAALKTDPEQQRLLKRAEQCVEDGRLDLAAILWQKVLDEAGDTLMSRDGRTYTSLAEEVERALAKLPPEALATYRISADGEAQAILAAATPDQEEDALAQVVRRYFLSASGDDAAYKLACLALDRYDFVGASRLLTRILERHPDPSIPQADLLLRLAVASARMGDSTTAEASLGRFDSVTGPRPPSQIVNQVREDVARTATLATSAGLAGQDWHMMLGNPSRTGHMRALPDVVTSRTLSELWSKEYPLTTAGPQGMNPAGVFMMGGGMVIRRGGRADVQSPAQAHSREDVVAEWREHGWKPTPQLLFDGGRVYVKTPDEVIAYSTAAHNDRPVWLPAWQNQYELDGMSQAMAMMAMSMGYNNQLMATGKPKTAIEVQLFGDRVHQAMSISGGVLYSIEGRAYSRSTGPKAAVQKPFQWGVTPRRTRNNWLTAYSATGGKVIWTRPASDDDKEGNSDVGFLGAPVPCGNLLIVPVTDGGTIWLYGLSADDGKTVWKSYLCDEPQGGVSPWSPIAVAVDGREAYLTCGSGVVFAIDAVGGTIRWAVRYKRHGRPNLLTRHIYGNQPSGQTDPDGWDDDVVIPYGKILVVMSSDHNKLFALDRRTGEFEWEAPGTSSAEPPASYCVGVSGSGLIVAGKNVVRRFDILGGRMVWEKEIDDSFGRGCITDNAIYMPVKDSILKLDLEKGRELAQVGVALTSDDPVGNLFSDGEKLWVVGAGRVYAMTTLEHRLQILAEQIAAGDPEAQLNRMRLYARQKQMDAALADLRGAVALFQTKLSPDDAARRLFSAINELKLPQTDPLVTLGLLNDIFVNAPSPPQLAKDVTTKRNNILAAAINVVRHQKLPTGAAAVLEVAPLIAEDYLMTMATQAVEATATPEDISRLKQALQSESPAARLMSIRSLVRLAPSEAKAALPPLLDRGDDRVRLAAARALISGDNRGVLGTFVSLLESENPRVRAQAQQSLRAVTGQIILFSSEGKPEDRARAVAAWKQWVAAHGATAQLKLPLTDQNVPLGRILYVSQPTGTMIELDSDHKKIWEVKVGGQAYGCQGLPNGHRLVAIYAKSLVVEYNAEGKEIWRTTGLPGPPYSVQRLENGNTLVACADVQQIIEIAPDGTLTPTNVQGQPMSAQRLENGNTLVALRQGNRVVEIDAAGKIVWEARTGNGPSHAVRLESGNTLITLLYSRQVAEFDPTGKNVVWRSQVPLVNPHCAQRLPNGNTLVSDQQGLHEIDESGQKVIWQLLQTQITGVSSF